MNKHINTLMSLEGKCAVVVGGKGKVGFPISEALAEAGATVYIASPSSSDEDEKILELKNKGLKVFGRFFDQSNELVINEFLEYLDGKGLHPNILVNSGVRRPMKKFMDDKSNKWDESMQFNSRGLFLTCRAFSRKMQKNNGGSIINISSIYGIVAPDKLIYKDTNLNTEPDYAFNKGGMIMFSKYLASYLAEFGIRVNCIAPGGIYNNQNDQFVKNYIKKVPLGRMAYPEDMKGIAKFLASNASQYITGTTIPVDGGLTSI